MMSFVWVIVGAVVLLALLSGNSKRRNTGPVRIDHPHVIDEDDYECAVCHHRFRKNVMICPKCGARFTGRVEDGTEWDEEEDEMEAWDEEDG